MIDALLDEAIFGDLQPQRVEIPPGAWSWVFEFLLAHDKQTGTSSPYTSGLPDSFPEYCSLADAVSGDLRTIGSGGLRFVDCDH